MSTDRILVALATYNEIENLPSLVEAILQRLPDADVLVVDDNSPDGTGRWCDEQAAGERRLRCLHRPSKQGIGSATIEAIGYAMEHDYDVLVTLDADWSHDPSALPALVSAIESADVAVGSRYCTGGQIDGWPFHRRAMSRSMNALTRAVLRLPVRDASGSYRAYRVARLRELRLEEIRSGGYAYLEEILWLLHRLGASLAEVPISFRQRRGGRSKITVREAAAKIATLVRLAWRS